MIKVKDVEHLKTLCMEHKCDYILVLSGGLRSSKDVYYNKDSKTFEVMNLIDGSDQELTEAELFTESNIGEAITKGNFWCED